MKPDRIPNQGFSWGLLREIDQFYRREDLRQERCLRTGQRLDRKVESVDPPVDALVEQARERAYHLEALVVLQAGSGMATQEREARVMDLY